MLNLGYASNNAAATQTTVKWTRKFSKKIRFVHHYIFIFAIKIKFYPCISMQLRLHYAWLKNPKMILFSVWYFSFLLFVGATIWLRLCSAFSVCVSDNVATVPSAWIFLRRNEPAKEVYFICYSILYYALLTWAFLPFIWCCSLLLKMYLQWNYVVCKRICRP